MKLEFEGNLYDGRGTPVDVEVNLASNIVRFKPSDKCGYLWIEAGEDLLIRTWNASDAKQALHFSLHLIGLGQNEDSKDWPWQEARLVKIELGSFKFEVKP
jgi:hypothetical protein